MEVPSGSKPPWTRNTASREAMGKGSQTRSCTSSSTACRFSSFWAAVMPGKNWGQRSNSYSNANVSVSEALTTPSVRNLVRAEPLLSGWTRTETPSTSPARSHPASRAGGEGCTACGGSRRVAKRVTCGYCPRKESREGNTSYTTRQDPHIHPRVHHGSNLHGISGSGQH